LSSGQFGLSPKTPKQMSFAIVKIKENCAKMKDDFLSGIKPA
jgi:hypothetical protein